MRGEGGEERAIVGMGGVKVGGRYIIVVTATNDNIIAFSGWFWIHFGVNKYKVLVENTKEQNAKTKINKTKV